MATTEFLHDVAADEAAAGASSAIATVRTTPLDPQATQRSVAELAYLTAMANAAVAKYIGQPVPLQTGGSYPMLGLPVYSGDISDGQKPPILDGDSLTLAIAKLVVQLSQWLPFVNRHPLPPGTVIAYMGDPSLIPSIDLLPGDDPTVPPTGSVGSFFVLMDGGIHSTIQTIDMTGNCLIGAVAGQIGNAFGGLPVTPASIGLGIIVVASSPAFGLAYGPQETAEVTPITPSVGCSFIMRTPRVNYT
jgi:hypothetical protein